MEAVIFGKIVAEKVLVLFMNSEFLGRNGRYDKKCLWSYHRAREG